MLLALRSEREHQLSQWRSGMSLMSRQAPEWRYAAIGLLVDEYNMIDDSRSIPVSHILT